MIIVRSVINEIIKKKIKLISYYHFGVVVYNFTHLKKQNIYGLLKGMFKDSHFIYININVKNKGIFKVFINLKTNEKPMVIN